jgi:hypothetical protein
MSLLLIVALLAGGGMTMAQEAETEEGDRERLRDRLRRAIQLPRRTEEAREAGVPEERVREILRTGREREIRPDEMEVILEVENHRIREGGPVDNFGAAVQEMKASGLRGRALAEAIHAEQVARGMKRPKGAPPGQAKQKQPDKPKGKGQPKKGQGRGKN